MPFSFSIVDLAKVKIRKSKTKDNQAEYSFSHSFVVRSFVHLFKRSFELVNHTNLKLPMNCPFLDASRLLSDKPPENIRQQRANDRRFLRMIYANHFVLFRK